jgi:hypothetical protein
MASDCGWKRVDHFESLAEYEETKALITAQVKGGLAQERRVAKPYSGLETLDERWYKCSVTKEVWRLVAPDPPFPGVFEPV